MNQPRFKVGDKVWVIDGFDAIETAIKSCHPATIGYKETYEYKLEYGDYYLEHQIFSTAEELAKRIFGDNAKLTFE